MKIGSTDPIRVGTAKAKKSEVKGSGFHELLHTRLDDIQPEARQDNSGDAAERSGNTLEIMEDAALMLDKALEQIQQDGQPSEEIADSLSKLRDQLKQRLPDSENLKSADAIIAVETSRLQSWKL